VEKKLEESFLRDLHSSDLDLLYQSLERHAHTRPSKPTRQVAPLATRATKEPAAVAPRTAPGPPRSQSQTQLSSQSMRLPVDATALRPPDLPRHSAPSLRRAGPFATSTAAAAAALLVLAPPARHRKTAAETKHERWVADTAAALAVEQQQGRRAAVAMTVKARLQLQVARASLPLRFLAQHDFANDAKKEGLGKIIAAVQKLVLQAYAGAFGRWRAEVAAAQLVALVAAGAAVQRSWRGHAVRRHAWVRISES
jgi:hypothetical protein